jgi:hypothetical protein
LISKNIASMAVNTKAIDNGSPKNILFEPSLYVETIADITTYAMKNTTT